MAKLPMKYIEIAAPLSESKEIFDYLQMQAVIELTGTEEVEGLSRLSAGRTPAQFEKYRAAAGDALRILDDYAPEKKSLLAGLAPLPEMTFAEYLKKSDEADGLLGVCYEICGAERTVTQARAAIARLKAARTGLEPWLELDVPMKFSGTKQTAALVGTLPGDYTEQTLTEALLAQTEAAVAVEVVSHSKERSCIFAVCEKAEQEAVFAALRTLGFAFVSDPTRHPPKVRYERYGEEIKTHRQEIADASAQIRTLADRRRDLEFVYDYFSIRHEKYDALQMISTSGSAVVISGYIPEKRVEKLTAQLESHFTVAVAVSDPPEDADVPVLLENNGFAGAVEGITKMYAMPGKEDVDPNPVMAFFYYIFFGIMLSDAGYGLLMVLGTLFAKLKYKPTGNMKKTVDMYFYCGIATVFWGTLFGSWFGDIIPQVAKQFFGKDVGSLALWFEPVNDPMKLMLYAFLFGIIHLFVGLGVSFYNMWRQGNKVGAICDVIPVYLFVTGLAPLGASIVIDVPPMILNTGKWLLIIGTVLIVLTAGRSSKNIIGKFGLGLYGLYNTASGWLSDILSYSRLLALGLCTGVIASVINTLGLIPSSKPVKLALLIPVFIFGHAVNMAINLIGTYVHTNRLQYVEFFSKFYEGGGRSFTPLHTNTKYFNLKED